DHAGGALAVRNGLPVGRVLSGDAAGLPAQLFAESCVSGERWEWDGVSFALWQWPDATDSNQRSCVLQIEASGERLLLTGDIDIQAEQAFLQSPLAVAGDWLQAPHHGSRSSSSMAFLQRLAPRAVLISRAHGNAFGHPHPQVMARYQALGMQVHDSAEQGAVRLQLGAFGAARSQREQRRFWRWPAED
ncbi:MBL fold metallo-hydrolase, partial [Pseudomonas gingeri]|uniref:ComEC/Rec2 family competence protein n=1 Tax=Pseudomonas gingeri TaxID=117681 RepID=UPI0015BBC5D7